MGANAASIEEPQLMEIVSSEFQSLHKAKDYAILGEVLKYNPPEDYKLHFHHLPTLYSLDSNKDGRFCMQDIATFAKQLKAKSKCFQAYELLSQIKGAFALDMCNAIKKNGVDDFVAWIGRLLLQGPTSMRLHRGYK